MLELLFPLAKCFDIFTQCFFYHNAHANIEFCYYSIYDFSVMPLFTLAGSRGNRCKQHIPILYSLVLPHRGSNPRSTALEASMPTITPPMQFLSFELCHVFNLNTFFPHTKNVANNFSGSSIPSVMSMHILWNLLNIFLTKIQFKLEFVYSFYAPRNYYFSENQSAHPRMVNVAILKLNLTHIYTPRSCVFKWLAFFSKLMVTTPETTFFILSTHKKCSQQFLG
jgi:hypothetical protein